ncbi:MAG: nuclear transport factor 2 family protein [Cyclobacteriaceae bacterium]
MKYTMNYALMLFAFGCMAQSNANEEVKNTIEAFAKAADQNDSKKLDQLLDDNFRIAMNQMFGSKEVQTVDKTFYLSKIESKEWGGDDREVTISDLVVVGKNATAKVMLVGSKSTMTSILSLVKTADGNWKILQDIPTMS